MAASDELKYLDWTPKEVGDYGPGWYENWWVLVPPGFDDGRDDITSLPRYKTLKEATDSKPLTNPRQ